MGVGPTEILYTPIQNNISGNISNGPNLVTCEQGFTLLTVGLMVVARLAFISASKALVPDPIPGIPYLGIPGGFRVGLSSSNSSEMIMI